MPGFFDMARARPPPADTIHRSGVPRRYEVKAICAAVGRIRRHQALRAHPGQHLADRAPSAPTLAISLCRPVMAKAMREPKMPRVPVNWPMTSFTHS